MGEGHAKALAHLGLKGLGGVPGWHWVLVNYPKVCKILLYVYMHFKKQAHNFYLNLKVRNRTPIHLGGDSGQVLLTGL